MKCPRCENEKTYVLKTTRPEEKSIDCVKQRRRVCKQCKRPFMTFEVFEADYDRLMNLIKLEGPTRSPLQTRKIESPPDQKNS